MLSPGAVGAKATGAHVVDQARVTAGTGGAFSECRQPFGFPGAPLDGDRPGGSPCPGRSALGRRGCPSAEDGRAPARRRHRDARLVLTPIYVAGRERLSALHAHAPRRHRPQRRHRHPADSLDVIARPDGRTGAAFVSRSGRSRDSGSPTAATGRADERPRDRRRQQARYRYLVHSQWKAGQPQYSQLLDPPAGLADR